jgi:hypothetical protein
MAAQIRKLTKNDALCRINADRAAPPFAIRNRCVCRGNVFTTRVRRRLKFYLEHLMKTDPNVLPRKDDVVSNDFSVQRRKAANKCLSELKMC